MRIRYFVVLTACLAIAGPVFAQGPPDFSGPIVSRFEDSGYWYGYTDFKRGYVAFHGVDIDELCEYAFAGGGTPSWDVWSFQDVNLPPAEALLHTVQKGDDMTTSVYSIDILFYPVHFCYGVLDLDPIATGTTDIVITDNDVYAWQDEYHPRTNAYKLSAHGVLYSTADGEPMIFSGGFNCQWPGYPEDPETSGKCKEKIVLN